MSIKKGGASRSTCNYCAVGLSERSLCIFLFLVEHDRSSNEDYEADVYSYPARAEHEAYLGREMYVVRVVWGLKRAYALWSRCYALE